MRTFASAAPEATMSLLLFGKNYKTTKKCFGTQKGKIFSQGQTQRSNIVKHLNLHLKLNNLFFGHVAKQCWRNIVCFRQPKNCFKLFKQYCATKFFFACQEMFCDVAKRSKIDWCEISNVWQTMFDGLNRKINQSINQTISQSNSQSNSQSINESIKQSIQSIKQSIKQSINQWNSQSTSRQSIKQQINQSDN